VRLLGYRHDVPALMQVCDLVVHPTEADALPTVLLHAVAAGRAVVASHVGGVPDVIGDEGGILVPPGDPAALREALLTLSRDQGLRERLGAAGRRRFALEFDAARWAERLREVYEEARRRQPALPFR
jgi:glycosyltransferase involved in cell wall biosynthesis